MKCSTLENTITKKKKTTKKNIAKNKNNGKPKQNNNNTNKNGQQSQIRRLLAWGIMIILCLLFVQHIYMHECGILSYKVCLFLRTKILRTTEHIGERGGASTLHTGNK